MFPWMKMVINLFATLVLITSVLSHVEIIDLDSLDWIAINGETSPILRIVIHNEIISLPLQEAPFCHFGGTRKCECFILRKGNDSSGWEFASLVKCGGEFRGKFMNTRYHFEITPKVGSRSGQHIVKKYNPEGNSTRTAQRISNKEQKEKTVKDAEPSFGYSKPLPEYGELFENETGYIIIKFVLSKSFDSDREDEINLFLEGLMIFASYYLEELNLLAGYKGWTRALKPDRELNHEVIETFVHERYRIYDEENVLNVVILLGKYEQYETRSVADSICQGPGGIFVAYLTGQRKKQSKILLYALGRSIGLPKINRTVCDPGEGYWIMEDPPRFENLRVAWSNCSKEFMKKKLRKHLACSKREIKPPRASCGNGWVDDGEQCDCITKECRKCCHNNCTLTEGSKRSNGPCCNKSTCMFRDAGTQCRAAGDFCDIPELCDGKSGDCPSNFVVANGYECQESPHRSYCFKGKCGSRVDMCRWAFQNGSVAPDSCYKLNTENGKHYGGCGPTFQSYWTGNISYDACEGSDMYCGKIYCHFEGAEQGNYSYTPESLRYFTGETLAADHKTGCVFMKLYKYYRFLQEDPTFVPSGSECAPDHMCVKQRCTPLPEGCPRNCPGVPRVHPYTKQVFPAYEIDLQPKPRESGPSPIIWLYSLFGSLILMSIIAGLYYIYPEYSKTLSEASTDHTSRFTVPSESRETIVRTLSEPVQSQKLSDDN